MFCLIHGALCFLASGAGIQGDMQVALESIPLAGVATLPGLKALLGCCNLIKEFSLPGTDDSAAVASWMKFASSLEALCHQVQAPSGLLETLDRLGSWCKQLEEVCNAKAMEMIIANPAPEKPWDYKQILSAKYHSLAFCLQVAGGANLSDTVNAFNDKSCPPDLLDTLKHLNTFETVSSALKLDVFHADDMFPGRVSHSHRHTVQCWSFLKNGAISSFHLL